MLTTILLYYHTILHLKWKQIFFRVYYALKTRNRPLNINKSAPPLKFFKSSIAPFAVRHLYKGNLTFKFLNIEHRFEGKINWDIQQHGTLWNYHLQYANYLLDEDIELNTRLELLKDLYHSISNHQLALKPYPVSIRVVNVYYFISAHNIEDPFIRSVLYTEYQFLLNNFEYHIDGNHLLENHIGAIVLSLAFGEDKTLHRLFKEFKALLEEQILEDGAYYEVSMMYHRHILYRLLLLYNTLINANAPPSYIGHLHYWLTKMLSWLDMMLPYQMYCFGDSVAQLPDSDYSFTHHAQKLGLLPVPTTASASGLRIWRWPEAWAIIQLRGMEPTYQPGHCHADLLHFVLHIKGKEVIVDTGISTYEAGEKRLSERSTSSHNTVSLAGQNQSELWDVFRAARRARPTIHQDDRYCIKAEVINYNKKFKHEREFIKKNNEIEIIDKVTPGAPATANIHFGYRLAPEMRNSGEFLIQELGVEIIFINQNSVNVAKYEQALDFNKCMQATKIEVAFRHHLKTIIRW